MKMLRNSLLTLAAIAAGILLGTPFPARSAAVTQNGVTVDLLFPAPGSVVSNTITLTAEASSLAGPIAKVEFYVDGKLIGTATNRFAAPGDVFVY